MTTLNPTTLIKAGAGAGKTHTIQSQLTSWVREGAVQPDRILAVTFTKAAANEMRQRIRIDLLKAGLIQEANRVQDATITTIHAFGLEILQSFAWEKGLSPEPRQLTEHEQKLLLNRALNQVETIGPLIDNLQQYGYSGTYKGTNWVEAADQLQNMLLSVTNHLRSLGKGEAGSGEEAETLLQEAQNRVRELYGHTFKAEPLRQALWVAIETLKTEYPNKAPLKNEWGSSDATKAFVDAIYDATPERLEYDWPLWKKLQETTGRTLKRRNAGGPENAHLAESIWDAADQLQVHPGPIDEALYHIECLLSGALEALDHYQNLKVESGLIDYGDMVTFANTILDDPEWRHEIAGQFDCLIIDEFQDTNPLQYALLQRLQEQGIPTLIVGDLKQSIMGFQGADPRLFNALLNQEQANQGNVSELTSNWRSTPGLMNFINPMGQALFGDDYQPLTAQANYSSELTPVHLLHFSKNIWKNGTKGDKPDLYREGGIAMANHIRSLLENKQPVTDREEGEQRPIKPSDIAVLARTHTKLQGFADALRQVGIRPQLQEPGLFDCPAVQWVLNALQWITNPNDRYSALALLTSPLINGHDSETLEAQLRHRVNEGTLDTTPLDALVPTANPIAFQPVSRQVESIIEHGALYQRLQQRENGHQERANLVTLLGLTQSFQQQQPETLQAQGLFGHSAATFQAWLAENREEFDTQTDADPQAEDAVTLKTWHGAKGLEWPVVLILQGEEARKTELPATDMAYTSKDARQMLEHSFVRILPDFADPRTKDRMKEPLLPEHDQANRNLYYVAMTRAREQLILSWYGEPKEGSLIHRISNLFKPETDATFEYQETAMTSDMATPPELESTTQTRKTFPVHEHATPEKLENTKTPSLSHESAATSPCNSEELHYGSPLALEALRTEVRADELGSWIHRLYQTNLKNPNLIDRVFALAPVEDLQQQWKAHCLDHLNTLKQTLHKQLNMIQAHCECPVLALNQQGQTLSGIIDLLVETDEGYWVIDHKTDTDNDASKHWSQIQAYANCLNLEKPVLGLAVNWTQHGILETLEFGKQPLSGKEQ